MEPTRVGQRMLVEVGGAVIQIDVTLLSQTPHGLQMAASADVPMTGNRLFNRLPPEVRPRNTTSPAATILQRPCPCSRPRLANATQDQSQDLVLRVPCG